MHLVKSFDKYYVRKRYPNASNYVVTSNGFYVFDNYLDYLDFCLNSFIPFDDVFFRNKRQKLFGIFLI